MIPLFEKNFGFIVINKNKDDNSRLLPNTINDFVANSERKRFLGLLLTYEPARVTGVGMNISRRNLFQCENVVAFFDMNDILYDTEV